MKMRARILKWIDPEADELRVKIRDAMAEASAHADDVSRTVVLHGEKIAEMLRAYHDGNQRKQLS